MRARVRRGARYRGGILGYPLTTLYREVAFIAYHFHWPPESVLQLEHRERLRWVEEISAINEKLNSDVATH